MTAPAVSGLEAALEQTPLQGEIRTLTPYQKPRFEIDLATAKDDEELRAFLRRSPIPGSIRVIFEREPSFFDSCRIRGDFFQVCVGRVRSTGSIIGLGTRSVSPAYVNGSPSPLGYLADLRLDEQYRGGMLIARGYRFLRHLHEDGRTQLYATMIFTGNHAALTTIASGRAGLPRYHDMGMMHSPGINIRRVKPKIDAHCDIERGTDELLPEVVGCLNRNHARRQFAPVHSVANFKSQFRDFKITNFYVAVRGSRVVGVLGCWDQSALKQTRIDGYGQRLRFLMPLANAFRSITGGPQFPRVREEVAYFYISFVAVDRDDTRVFRALLRRAYNDSVGGKYLYAMIALHEHDPFLSALHEYSLTPFSGRLFCVNFEDGERVYKSLDQRVPYMEAATF